MESARAPESGARHEQQAATTPTAPRRACLSRRARSRGSLPTDRGGGTRVVPEENVERGAKDGADPSQEERSAREAELTRGGAHETA